VLRTRRSRSHPLLFIEHARSASPGHESVVLAGSDQALRETKAASRAARVLRVGFISRSR
jgi:hypothetical protein